MLVIALLLVVAGCQPHYAPCPTGVITITNPQADCPAGMPE